MGCFPGSGGQYWFFGCVFQQTPECPEAVLPSNFLTFFVSAAPVADAYLVNPQPPPSDLHRDLWLKSEAVLFDGDRLDDLPAEYFVAGLHVAQVDVGQAIGQQREDRISHRMPEIKHPVRAGSKKP